VLNIFLKRSFLILCLMTGLVSPADEASSSHEASSVREDLWLASLGAALRNLGTDDSNQVHATISTWVCGFLAGRQRESEEGDLAQLGNPNYLPRLTSTYERLRDRVPLTPANLRFFEDLMKR